LFKLNTPVLTLNYELQLNMQKMGKRHKSVMLAVETQKCAWWIVFCATSCSMQREYTI